MKPYVHSILSSVAILAFILGGLASDSDGGGYTCEVIFTMDQDYIYECKPLNPPVDKVVEYQLTLKDKSTGNTLSGIYCSRAIWILSIEHEMCEQNNATICFGYRQIYPDTESVFFEDASDGNGVIDGVYSYVYTDEHDRVMIKMLIRDQSGVYAPRNVYLRFDLNTGSVTQDVFLIKYSDL